jgi:hypothetical protein
MPLSIALTVASPALGPLKNDSKNAARLDERLNAIEGALIAMEQPKHP